ncbi:hypothetical protein V6N13_043970 [Hibiscus sabdariffa]
MVDSHGQWRCDMLQQLLPTYILLRLVVVKGPSPPIEKDMLASNQSNDIAPVRNAVWQAPLQGFYKLNTDGSRGEVDGRASYGGVLYSFYRQMSCCIFNVLSLLNFVVFVLVCDGFRRYFLVVLHCVL